MKNSNRRYFILEEYWDQWGVVEEEDAYIYHDSLADYARWWDTTVEELLKELIEV